MFMETCCTSCSLDHHLQCFRPSVSTQVSVREADDRIKPRVERGSAEPWGDGRKAVKPTEWAAAIVWWVSGEQQNVLDRAKTNCLPPTPWANGFFPTPTQGSALPRSTLGFILSPASQAEEHLRKSDLLVWPEAPLTRYYSARQNSSQA